MDSVSPEQSKVKCVRIFFAHENRVFREVDRSEARSFKLRGEAYFINHGKDMRLNDDRARISQIETEDGVLFLRWGGYMNSTLLNRGRSGQFHYPIPYVYEGHLTMPRAARVNGTDYRCQAGIL